MLPIDTILPLAENAYLLFMALSVLYFWRLIYKNYQKGLPLGEGQNKVLSFVIVVCIAVGQYLIPSSKKRCLVFLIFALSFLAIYTKLDIHNKKNNTGERRFYYRKELWKNKICSYMSVGLVVVLILIVFCFEE